MMLAATTPLTLLVEKLGEGGTGTGAVKVSDFGIASLVDQRHTRTGMVMGTLGYMASEQRRSAAAPPA